MSRDDEVESFEWICAKCADRAGAAKPAQEVKAIYGYCAWCSDNEKAWLYRTKEYAENLDWGRYLWGLY